MNYEHIVRFNDIKVDLMELRVWHGEKDIHFTLSELRLLLVFLLEPYKVISRDELIKRVDLTNAGALYSLISRLRALLGQEYVFSRDGMGYSFARTGRLRIPIEGGEEHERTSA